MAPSCKLSLARSSAELRFQDRAECGKNSLSLTMTIWLFTIHLKQSWKKLSTQDHKFDDQFILSVCSNVNFDKDSINVY